MTTYNYLSEMQLLCFRAREALKVLNDDGMKDFYAAAEVGFSERATPLTFEKANEHINQSQIEAYLKVKKFTEEKEREAAEKLRYESEQQEARHE